MSCNNSTSCTVIVDAACSSLTVELGGYSTTRETDLQVKKSLEQGRPGLTADQSKSKKYRHEVQSRFVPDSTKIDPEYVWGDEGPING